ncbi:VOC family virulence protein [Cupriavidus sp. USMAHM13]|uniref:VOC family protein n=1 Tax=Cupriavidus sp. USMAHM13 TaxID=1389192 RepID=UPI0008A6F012|nr:VOC family protein [Cupriavidus sp. USMAHM13]AOY97991.1 VOC family virulence protein [Cupriavidus sp. USMAHM13]
MFRILGIDHLVLRSADVPAMLRFYVGVLGCTVEREQAALGLTQLRAGCALIDLVALDGPLGRAGGAGPGAQGRNLDHFCLRIDPFDSASLSAWLRGLGIEPGPPEMRYGAEGLGFSLYVRDPDGNVVELKGPAQPPGAKPDGMGA